MPKIDVEIDRGQSGFDRTHGRWPWAAAAMAAPSVALAWRARAELRAEGSWVYWLPLSALLLHQTEEWMYPGGFLPWFNREVMDSDADEWPITRRDGLAINVGLGWGTALAAGLLGPSRPGVAAAQLAMDVGNAGLHIAQGVRRRRYNPGLATAALLFMPIGIAGARNLVRRQEKRREVAIGFTVGVTAAATMLLTMKARVRRRRS